MQMIQIRSLNAFAVVLLAVACGFGSVSCAQSDSEKPGVRVVAAAGDPAPGLPDGYMFEGFESDYSMGASGALVFAASANIRNGGSRERKQALWFGKTGALSPIAFVGQAVPGLEDGTVIAAFERKPKVITQSGRLGFLARISRSSMNGSALLVYSGDELVAAVATGDMLPMQTGEGRLQSFSQFAMSDRGVLFAGQFGRRQSGIWFWDFSELQLVAADGATFRVGDDVCVVNSVASTSLDINRDGLAVFRLSLGGSECPVRGGVVAWNAESNTLIPVAMNRTPIAEGSDRYFQSVTGDARVGDDGHIALHADVYANDRSSAAAKEMTLIQRQPGDSSALLFTRDASLGERPDIKFTHAILGGGLGVVHADELVHFVKSNRDSIILRTRVDDPASHTLIANTGSTVGDQVAARIGDAAVNRNGDVVFTSFIDDGPRGGIYQQEVWLATRGDGLKRLAFPGQAVLGRMDETIAAIDAANQSHEPTMASTQGGRARTVSDSGATVFSGRLLKGSQWQNALFVATPE